VANIIARDIRRGLKTVRIEESFLLRSIAEWGIPAADTARIQINYNQHAQ